MSRYSDPLGNKRPLKAVSLFSGCGGFDWGATQGGIRIVWANDVDSYAIAAYRSILPDVELLHQEIAEVKSFPTADVLIGCYPCTGFSLAARRRWRKNKTRDLKADDGNFLFREFIRALKAVKPRYFFVENVGGMSSAEAGWFFKCQLRGFAGLGYEVKYRVLDASDYGVAQTRRRLFLVGVRSDLPFEYVFPEPTHGQGVRPRLTLGSVISGMREWPDGEFLDYRFHGHYLTRNRKRSWDQPSFTIVADCHHVPLHPMGEPMVFVEKDRWKLQGDQNRRLSWRECARIQGLPAALTPIGSLSFKYKVIGNAVPPAFGRILVEPIVRFEETGEDENIAEADGRNGRSRWCRVPAAQ
jgi:DNA (cytosine-5)-methyltransferase 1